MSPSDSSRTPPCLDKTESGLSEAPSSSGKNPFSFGRRQRHFKVMATSSFLLFFLLAVVATASDFFGNVLNEFGTRSGLEQLSVNPNVMNYTATHFTQYGAQGVQIKYGPFLTYSATNNSGMIDYTQTTILMPCNDCLITFMQAGLEYPNGTYANTDTGMMLHHVVLTENGGRDSTCPKLPSRMFASGNERTPIDLTVNGSSKTGYYVSANASMGIVAELMNENDDNRYVTVTINFEYIPGIPNGFTQLHSWWLDVTGPCGDSDEPVPANEVVFNYTTPSPYTAVYNGSVLGMSGHLHDGGVLLTVSENNRVICNVKPTYGATAGYIDGSPMMNMPMGNMPMDMTHLSNMSTCVYPGNFVIGDSFSISAYYNSSEYPLMLDASGQPEPVMGISIMYVTNGTHVPSGSTTSGSGSTSTSSSSPNGASVPHVNALTLVIAGLCALVLMAC